jgi:hypothetical protein
MFTVFYVSSAVSSSFLGSHTRGGEKYEYRPRGAAQGEMGGRSCSVSREGT